MRWGLDWISECFRFGWLVCYIICCDDGLLLHLGVWVSLVGWFGVTGVVGMVGFPSFLVG